MEINVRVADIDYCAKKQDALIVYMKNGKVWVCVKEQELPKNNDLFIALKLKGKCDK